MFKRLIIGLMLIATGVAAAAVVFAAFINPHQATGTINTAVSSSEALYICQPSGTTVSPQCPIDTNGADELIFAASEDLQPGSVEWQKIRVTNTGSDPWDILSMAPVWTETADPGADCSTLPEAVRWNGSTQSLPGGTAPGVTILGNSFTPAAYQDPFGTYYSHPGNDNHGSLNSSATFYLLDNSGYSVHVAPGGFEDLLLGIRLPIGTPDACFDVVWTLTTTWAVQLHIP